MNMGNKRRRDAIPKETAVTQQSVKRFKSEIKTGTIQRSLIELNEDVLVAIFRWLNLNDLMTMMKVTDRFHEPIYRTFTKKFGKECTITMFSRRVHSDVLRLEELSTIIPCLRHFGHSIKKLYIIFDEDKPDHCSEIEKSVIEYCGGLRELELCFCRKGAFDAITKPFPLLEVLVFNRGYLGQTISEFNKWFPNLRILKMHDVAATDEISIKGELTFLDHLDIDIKDVSKKFSRKNLDGAMSLNPHLRSIRLSFDFKPRDLRFIARKMSQLEKLELQICPKNLKKGLTRPIEFKFLKHLVLTIFDIHVTVENFPLVCDKLEKLEVHCCAWQDVWFNFAHQNKLTTLTLLQLFGVIGGHGPPKEFLMKVAKNWPNLTDARVQVDDLSSNEIARFIMECKNLQRMEISDASPRWSEKCNEVTSKLRNEWKSVPSTEEKKYLIIRK